MIRRRSTCSLCEACCACLIDIQDDEIVRVRPDPEDPLAKGYICAKGAAIPEYEADPDRLRQPMVRVDGELRPASWESAFELIQARLPTILEQHGGNAVAIYSGNGAGRSSDFSEISHLLSAIGTRNYYTSGTLDQIPFFAVNALLFGNEYSAPIPDLDRCKLLWILGANPSESNGSMVTAPGIVGRLARIRKEGGKVVVFDPRRTGTARRATEYHAITPSGDAAFLAAVAHVLLEAGPAKSNALELCGDITALKAELEKFTPETCSAACGIDAGEIRRLALELRDTNAAAVYGRMGTTTQQFSSLTCWLIALVNILAGNLDAPGGAMFTKPVSSQANTYGQPGIGRGAQSRMGRWRSRVRKAPEMFGELPVSCLPEEMTTPGQDQVRALITFGANPVVSNPHPDRMAGLLQNLELFISFDIYVTESNRFADVIFPSPPRLARHQFEEYFYKFAVRNYARYTPAFRELKEGESSDRETILRLAAIAKGDGWAVDIDAVEEATLEDLVCNEIRRRGSPLKDRDPLDIVAQLRVLPPHERRIDLGIRVGPYGDAFGTRKGLSLQDLKDQPTGVDLGALAPRLPEILRTPSGQIEIAQEFAMIELGRLSNWIKGERPRFVLVGRRQLRSLNSAMRNIRRLQHNTRSCKLTINTQDADELGIGELDLACVSNKNGSITVEVELSDDIAPGVVSLPHGWGGPGLEGFQEVAATEAGVNVNYLTDPEAVDPLTGTVQLNGIAVDIARAGVA